MAPWPKHLRPRWRYLAVSIETPADVTIARDDVQAALWSGTRHLLGDVTSARLGMEVVRFGHADGQGRSIVRVTRDGVEDARAVLATLDRVAGHPVRFDVRGVSGTIRACEENYLGAAGEPASHDTVTFDAVETDAIERGDAVDFRIGSTPLGATTLDIT